MIPSSQPAKRGETLVVGLEAAGAMDADIVGVLIDAGLKRAGIGNTVPPTSEPRVATFSVAARASTVAVGPGWNLSLSAAQTLALPPGVYVTDASLTMPNGAVAITDPVVIYLAQGVSR